jgi:hypothetical protein
VLALLARLNRTTVFLVTVGLALLGLFIPGLVGALLVLALVGGLGLLLVRTWPLQSAAARVPRLLILALLAAVAIMKIT